MESLKFYLINLFSENVIDFWLSKINPIYSLHEKRGIQIKKKLEANNVVSIYYKVNNNVIFPKPGQHLDISVEIDGRRITRSYSPTFIDEKNKVIAITVKKIEKGKVSTWLFDQSKKGDIVLLDNTYGDFFLPTDTHPTHLFATGCGITPFISLLRNLKNTKQLIQLHYWVKNRSHACFLEELKNLKNNNPLFKFTLYLTQEKAKFPYEREGRIDQNIVYEIDSCSTTHILTCGSTEYTRKVERFLKSIAKSFQKESFYPPKTNPITEKIKNITLTLTKQNKTVTISNQKTILEELESQGINHPYGCRMGICNTCSCHKFSGETHCTSFPHSDTEENKSLKICTSYARSNLILDI